MKRLLLLLMVLWLSLASHAQGVLGRAVTVEAEKALLEDVLYQISGQEGVSLSFSSDIIPQRRVSLHVHEKPLGEVLKILLKDTRLLYRSLGEQAVIYLSDKAYFTLSGFLEDAETGERLINANILAHKHGKGATTNEYGFYSLTLPAGPLSLSFSYLGYGQENRELMLLRDETLNLSLKPTLTLQPVEVVGERLALPPNGGGGQGHSLDVGEAERLPMLGGESDIIRVAHLLPGVQTGTDGVGGLHIRGGNNGQNLIMIDGVPVYNIAHAAGIFSVFNTSAVRSARLIKGGFPARYGGRLSSVLDIRTREGNRKSFGAEGDVGLLSGRLSLEGPIVKDKSSFFFSGRWSFVDWYLQPLTRSLKEEKGEDGFIGYGFKDINAKLNYSLSEKDHLYLSLYSGSDRYSNTGASTDTLKAGGNQQPTDYYLFDKNYDDRINWGNTVASLRWNHLFSDKLFANFAATYSSFDVDISYFSADSLTALGGQAAIEQLLDVGKYESEIRDVGLRLDVDYIPSPNHYIRFGANLVHHHFLPGLLVYDVFPEKSENGEIPPSGEVGRPAISAMEYVAYVEDEFQLGSRLTVNAGLHAAAFNVRQKTYWSLQPRLNASYQALPDWRLEAYYNQMQQFIHLLSNSALGLPTEVWVPSTEEVAPQQAWQAGLASTWALRRGWNLSLEGYFKRMSQLLAYSEGALFLNDWEKNVTTGKGYAYGLEAMLSKKIGKTRGWAAYSLSWADRQYEFINNGLRYPYKYDRRHDFKLALSHKIQDWVELSANWIYTTGFAFSLPIGEYEIELPGSGGEGITVIDYGEKNSSRMPAYHRLDVSANFHFNTDEVEHSIQVGVYNLYNRRNPLYYSLRNRFVEDEGRIELRKEFVQAWLLPALPSFNYSIRF